MCNFCHHILYPHGSSKSYEVLLQKGYSYDKIGSWAQDS